MEANRPRAPMPPAEKRGVNWRGWLIGIAVALLVIFVALNFQTVEVKFIFGTTRTPLIFALLIAAALGALVGWLLPVVRRSRRTDRPGGDGRS